MGLKWKAGLVPGRVRRASRAVTDRDRAVATPRVVAIGASAGGTEALEAVLPTIPPDGPTMVIVIHMPGGFTRDLAERLDRICRMEVREAADGDRLVRGRALVAPGQRHMRIKRNPLGWEVQLTDDPPQDGHRPSIDVLFRSVALAAGPDSVGVIR